MPGFEVFHEGTSAILSEALGEEAAEQLVAEGASAAKTRPLADLTSGLLAEQAA